MFKIKQAIIGDEKWHAHVEKCGVVYPLWKVIQAWGDAPFSTGDEFMARMNDETGEIEFLPLQRGERTDG